MVLQRAGLSVLCSVLDRRCHRFPLLSAGQVGYPLLRPAILKWEYFDGLGADGPRLFLV